MRISYLLCCLLSQSAYAATSFPLVYPAPGKCYSSIDGIGYNSFQLQLIVDGTYIFSLDGDVGRWGSASGTWKQTGAAIVLHETSDDGHVTFPSILPLLGDGSLKLAYDGPYYSSRKGTNLLPRKCAR